MYGIYEFIYIYVYGTYNGFLCMASMNLYIFMCICSCQNSNSANKKKFWAKLCRRHCYRRSYGHMAAVHCYAEGKAVGVCPLYAEGKAVGV
jgi:hypothetical protein